MLKQREHTSFLLANLIPIISVLLDSLILRVAVACWGLFFARHTRAQAHTRGEHLMSHQSSIGRLSQVLLKTSLIFHEINALQGLLQNCLFYCYRSKGKNPQLSIYWWRALCNVSVIFTLTLITHTIYIFISVHPQTASRDYINLFNDVPLDIIGLISSAAPYLFILVFDLFPRNVWARLWCTVDLNWRFGMILCGKTRF